MHRDRFRYIVNQSQPISEIAPASRSGGAIGPRPIRPSDARRTASAHRSPESNWLTGLNFTITGDQPAGGGASGGAGAPA
ncbi:hypothetical protein ABZU76_24240, partial [Amycolatopsis sp. NPDC005232]|uniref:hypothetical protein n=1 Tax=Amycolatopsis sp. NPDC005232 TaxID=3157027 RepID=UPI0033A9B351